MDVKTLVTKLGFEADTHPLENVEHKLEKITSALHFLGAAEIFKGLYELSEKFAGMGEQLISASISAGMTTDEFQKLAYAASQNAVSQEDLSTSLARLSRTLYEAKNGSESALESFQKANISPEQVAQLKDGQQAFYAISDAMASIPDNAQRVALAQGLLGRGSFKMIKLLEQGSGAIQKLGGEAEDMGAIIQRSALENLEVVEDTLSGFFLVVRNVSASIGAEFAPAVTQVTKGLERLWKTYGAIVTIRLQKWVYDASYVLGFLYGAFEDVTDSIGNFIAKHKTLTDAAYTLVASLTGVAGISLTVLFAVNALKNVFGKFASVCSAVGQGLSLLATPFKYVISLAALLQGGLTAIIFRMALLIEGVLPALSGALVSMAAALEATPVGVFVAALAAILLTGQAIWSMLNGKSFSETWLGQMLTKLLDMPSKLKSIYNWIAGNKADADVPMQADGQGSMLQSPNGFGSVAADRAAINNTSLSQIAELTNQQRSDRMLVADQLRNGLQGFTVAGPSVPMPAQSSSAGQPNIINNINSQIKIDTGGNLTPKQAAQAVQDGISQHYDTETRQAMRQTRTALLY